MNDKMLVSQLSLFIYECIHHDKFDYTETAEAVLIYLDSLDMLSFDDNKEDINGN